MLVTKPLDSARVQQMEHKLQPDNPSRLITQASNILSELTQFTGVCRHRKTQRDHRAPDRIFASG